MAVPGRLSVRIVAPLPKVAGKLVAPLLLDTVTVQFQVPTPRVTLWLTLSVFVAVRSGQSTAIGVVTVGGGLVSTVALALACEQLVSAVNVAVAVPSAWIIDCAKEMGPPLAVKAIGSPSNTLMSVRRTGPWVESCRKSAVNDEVLLGETSVTEGGLAARLRNSHGDTGAVGLSPPTVPTVSQRVELGPWLQPHQLSAAFTIEADPKLPASMDIPVGLPLAVVLLPTIRLKLTFSVPPDATNIPPPPSSPLPLAALPVMVSLLKVREVFGVPLMPENASPPPLVAELLPQITVS